LSVCGGFKLYVKFEDGVISCAKRYLKGRIEMRLHALTVLECPKIPRHVEAMQGAAVHGLAATATCSQQHWDHACCASVSSSMHVVSGAGITHAASVSPVQVRNSPKISCNVEAIPGASVHGSAPCIRRHWHYACSNKQHLSGEYYWQLS
jgi:hypothetical protein